MAIEKVSEGTAISVLTSKDELTRELADSIARGLHPRMPPLFAYDFDAFDQQWFTAPTQDPEVERIELVDTSGRVSRIYVARSLVRSTFVRPSEPPPHFPGSETRIRRG